VTPEDLGQRFASFRRTAFRLETLPQYHVDEDDEARAFKRFCDGQPVPDPVTDRAWPTFVRSATAAGKSVQRVRVVRRPLSQYVRFELEWGYPANEAAGEEIRILELGPDGAMPELPGHDFWMFDGLIVVRLEYDDGGRFIRPVAPSDNASRYGRCRDAVMRRAVPFGQYRRAAGFEVRAWRAEHGLPERIDNPGAVADVAAHLRRDRRTF
jgi:hypothetical protein